MRIDVLTLFPQPVRAYCDESILGIAQEKGVLDLHVHDIRAYTDNKHGKVDDKPFGGGPGMVLCCQPIIDAVEAVQALAETPGRLIFLGPEGTPLRQPLARALAEEARIVLVCGRYEGFDQRIFDILQPEILSIGDVVLSGGELPAMTAIEAVTRLLPGALGSAESLEHESFNDNHLDYPHYTQPADFRGHTVPDILRSGDHAKVDAWRAAQARLRTQRLRPDLLDA